MPKQRGLRSSNDAKAWKCRACGTINRPTKHQFFNLPSFRCTNNDCGKEFCGSFKFCLGEIKANGKTVVGEVQDQGELSQCVVYSYAKAVEIIERVSKVAEGTDPDLVDCIDPMDLHNKFDEKFPEVLSVDCLTRDFGLHRVLHTGLILRSEGAIKLESGKRYIASDVSTIPRDDFERICHNLAEGIPLIATYIAGERRSHLRYCQIYKAPPQFGPDGKRLEQLGHAVVLIGAGMKRGRRFFYFMSSWGEKFCPRKNKQGEIVTSGIGKLRETDLTKNVVRLSLPSETGVVRRLEDQPQLEISDYNYLLMMATKEQYSEDMIEKMM